MNELAADYVWLARVSFVGPINMELRYETKDEIHAFRHDLDFVRIRQPRHTARGSVISGAVCPT
jgi:hypothetical protein